MTAKSKRIRFVVSPLVLAVLALGSGFLLLEIRAKPSLAMASASNQLYTCGMDPQVIQDHPGKCQICGMTLTPLLRSAQSNAMDSSAIRVDAVMLQNMGFRSEPVRRGPLSRVIRTSGAI